MSKYVGDIFVLINKNSLNANYCYGRKRRVGGVLTVPKVQEQALPSPFLCSKLITDPKHHSPPGGAFWMSSGAYLVVRIVAVFLLEIWYPR